MSELVKVYAFQLLKESYDFERHRIADGSWTVLPESCARLSIEACAGQLGDHVISCLYKPFRNMWCHICVHPTATG